MSDISLNHPTYWQSQCTKTVVISKRALIGSGVQAFLKDSCFAVVGTLAGREALNSRHRPDAPDLFIVDAEESLRLTINLIEWTRGNYPNAKIALMADHFSFDMVRLGRAAGSAGFCLTGSSREVLIKSLELVMLGEVVLPSSVASFLVMHFAATSTSEIQRRPIKPGAVTVDPKLEKLSAREAEILRHLAEGAPNKTIARTMDVSEATIKVHVKAILRKIGVANRTQAAMWASTRLPSGSRSAVTA